MIFFGAFFYLLVIKDRDLSWPLLEGNHSKNRDKPAVGTERDLDYVHGFLFVFLLAFYIFWRCS